MVGTGGHARRGAAALMMLAVGMVATAFAVPPAAAAVLRLASILSIVLALGVAVADSRRRDPRA
ncbi:MAG: hypothetical protein KQH57_16195 [Actinomycetales bacterium]|nr:hypothetical protein [Actinomycetales bacterium]